MPSISSSLLRWSWQRGSIAFLLGGLLAAASPAQAQAPAFAWATACGSYDNVTTGAQANGPVSMATDAAGNAYVAGSFTGTATFGATTLTSQGLADLFVAKLDAQGNYLWAVAAGGPENDGANAVAVDAQGRVFVTGGFISYSLSLGPRTLFNSSASSETFVASLDANGQWRWAQRAGGLSWDYGASLAVDASGDVVVAGGFGGSTADYGLTRLANADARFADLFVAKLSNAGAWQWAVRAGGNYDEYLQQLVLDGQGHAIMSGMYDSSPAVFGPHTVTTSATGTGQTRGVATQVFVVQLDLAAQTWDWAVSGGVVPGPLAASTNNLAGLAYDGAGGLYVAGSFKGPTARFGSATLTNPGQTYTASEGGVYYTSDAYVARLDAATHTWTWARRLGSVTDDYAWSLAASTAGAVTVAGDFIGPTLSFDASTQTLTHAAHGYSFVAQLDGPTGAWRWARGQGPNQGARAQAMAGTAAGHLLLAGSLGAATAFDAAATLPAPPAQYTNLGFVARLGGGVLAAHPGGTRPVVAVWPNPARSELWVQGLPLRRPVELRDALGRRVASAVTPAAGPLHWRLPVHLPAGLYLLHAPGYAARRIVVE